jgi:hypothetical protein
MAILHRVLKGGGAAIKISYMVFMATSYKKPLYTNLTTLVGFSATGGDFLYDEPG